MTCKLYVGNIPYTMKAEDLSRLFEPHGAVTSSVVISDRETGRSRGFGFVEMETQQAATAAMQALNGANIGGRNVVVNMARDRPQGGPGGGGGGGGGGGYGDRPRRSGPPRN
ncbi:MAG: RNA-binding protein [Alphaproteobacteria bacterium]|nr:RNA-binding protein [Alphaproteobacteria bacterium]